MRYKLSDLANYSSEKIDITCVNENNYVSTENLLPNKAGVTRASKLPQVKNVNRFKSGDILVSNIRPYFKKIWLADKEGGHSADVLNFRVKEGIDNIFLYALLFQENFFNQMVLSSKGTKMPRGDKSAIMNLEFDVPSLNTQKKIGEVLLNFQDKIKINNQIISNLEELASTLFKRWFVDFEFPDENGNPYKSSGGKMIESELGDIPEVWEVLNLADVSEDIITGKTPSTKEKENYGDEIPFIKIPDMHNNTYVVNTESSLSSLGSSLHPKKLLPKNTICVSCIATPGLVSITSEESHTNQQINAILPKKNDLYFLYLNMKSKSNLIKELGSGGSTTLNLNKTQFGKIELVYPPEIIKETFNDFCSPLFLKILLLKRSNNQLVNLRDSLLPKLLSGEIEIPQGEDV
ncbi:Type I restriction-modification system, specificity subunit S [Brachybacterium faecium]|nr:Type I restriction-modification system, specificity subunit S [Brachybacterium faecium]